MYGKKYLMFKIGFFILFLFMNCTASALLKFEVGTYEIEGYLMVQDGDQIFLTINKDNDNETNFKLVGPEVGLLKSKDYHKVTAIIKLKNSVFSYAGEAELVRIKKYQSPTHIVKKYNLETEFKRLK